MTSPKINDQEFSEETLSWSRGYVGVNNKYPVMEIEERLRLVEKRLLIIAPDDDAMAKYPSLAAAYKEYKIIERLTLGNDQT